MKSVTILISIMAICIAAAMYAAATSAVAADNELTPKEKADGWQLLFDGKSLDNWMFAKSDGTTFEAATTRDAQTGRTPIEDGAINPHGFGAYMIINKEQRDDFVLALDFKISKGCNSGIFLRTSPLEAKPQWDVGANGIEVAVDDTTTSGLHDTGAVYDLVPPQKNAMKPVGEWNHIEITCKGDTIDVVLNGEAVTHIDLAQFSQPNKRPDGSDHKFPWAFSDHPKKGYVGLQDHGSACWYRNIKLRPFKG
jgi:hypothetical protein